MIEGLAGNWSTVVRSAMIEQGGTTVALPPGQAPIFVLNVASSDGLHLREAVTISR